MVEQDENIRRSPFVTNAGGDPSTRTVPILHPSIQTATSSPGDPMDVTSPTMAAMGPPARSSPEDEANGVRDHTGIAEEQGNNSNMLGPNAAVAAQAGTQQPKVVQTAFIHKLYNMLEDQSIRHLISWSNSAESFVMSPSNDFSKVLSQYFKHTNISSFVRQLNMYGFHKVSDVFHTGSPESPMWEFKHGNGNFKRGDLVGLREIKRRASRHALVHRDSYPSVKPPPYSQPGTPAEVVQPIQESTETRLTNVEHNLYDMHARLARSEENTNSLYMRNQILMEALSRSLLLNLDVSRALGNLVPNSDSPLHRSIIDMQAEFQRQADVLRSMEDGPEPPLSGSRQYFSNLSLDGAPVSPRQLAQDDIRRAPIMGGSTPRQNSFRPTVPSNLSITPRRYGSIGGATTDSSPSSRRYQAPPPPPPPNPMVSLTTPPTNLARRHTSADIRAHGWQPTPSPFAPSNSSSQWPSSPKRGPTISSEDQRIRDSFSTYTLQGASQSHLNISRPGTPPFPTNGTSTPNESNANWSWGSRGDKFGGPGFGTSGLLKDSSGPPTRRGSMAHILNPAETAEREEEHEEELREEDRKRKRVQ